MEATEERSNDRLTTRSYSPRRTAGRGVRRPTSHGGDDHSVARCGRPLSNGRDLTTYGTPSRRCLHEGQNVIYVARQLRHDARLTLTRYGHVMEEYEDRPQLNAEEAIPAARETLRTGRAGTAPGSRDAVECDWRKSRA